jgi:hypothetical protein
VSANLPLESYLPIASFALAAGGLAVRLFLPSGPAKQTLIAAIMVFLLLASGLLWRKNWEAKQQVREVADEIIGVIGNEKRTYEEILSGLRKPNYQVASAAIDFLIEEKRLGSEDATIVDKSDEQFRVRLYFVRSF